MIITIDGPAGTGKSTVAKKLADRLHYVHFDTGAMYRSFTYFLQQQGIDYNDHQQVLGAFKQFKYDIRLNGTSKRHFVGSQDVTEAIRSERVNSEVSQVAAIAEVRHFLVAIQKAYGKNNNAVFEGRDLGTVVFPDAELKIFLTASAEVRAKRRFDELKAKGETADYKKVLEELAERDRRDSHREVSPLRQAADAHLLDTSHLTIDGVVDAIVELIPRKAAR